MLTSQNEPIGDSSGQARTMATLLVIRGLDGVDEEPSAAGGQY